MGHRALKSIQSFLL